MTDRECLRAYARHPSAESFRPFIERYLAFVYSAAHRQTGAQIPAIEVTRAVFLALAYKARHLPRKTVLAGWLFRATRFACLKLMGKVKRRRQAHLAIAGAFPEALPDPLWTKLSPQLDEALDCLSRKQRDAVLLRSLLDFASEPSARILRTSERRVQQRAERGLDKVAKRLRKRGFPVERPDLGLACAANSRVPAPDGLALGILQSVEEQSRKRPSVRLARRTLRALYWAPWRRRLKLASICLLLFGIVVTAAGFYIGSLWRNGRLMAWFIEWSSVHSARSVPGLTQSARPWPANSTQAQLNANSVSKPADIYQITNVWLAHLKFSAEQWKSLQPKRVEPVPKILQPDGEVLLRNPRAQRSGLAGALGIDFNWAEADLEFGGVPLLNAAARFKGNGTYLLSAYGWKRSFKVNLKKFHHGQQLGGIKEINFTNLIDDRSYMNDALAYEFFREAGVPAPRTAYAWLTLSIAGQWDRKPLGLYLLVENVDGTFVAERFGAKKTPLFKPVTYKLFQDLGDEWSAYAPIYDLKTKANSEQQRRVIDFSRLVSHAGNQEFAQRVGGFLDLDEFARFLAGLVLLSSYDGFLSDGQNFYVYLHPDSNKFGFIPWDLDHAWGAFYLIGTPEERERGSIWHPWVGRNRFLERVMAVEQFRQIYRARLEELLASVFVPSRLSQRIDQIAQVIRSPIAAESSFRLEKFEQAVSDKWLPRAHEGDLTGPDRPVQQLKRFIAARAKSVRQQLDGESSGMIPGR